MMSLHHPALANNLSRAPWPEEMASTVALAAEFFLESVSPYEMTHRGYREAVAALHHLNETLEGEINKIVHAIHDEAGQLLIAAHLAVADMAREAPESLQERVRNVRILLDRVEQQLRRLSHELRPTILDDLGLVPAVQFLAGGMSKRSKLPVKLQATWSGRLPSSVESTLYRVIQGALSNAMKHSGAASIQLQLEQRGMCLHCSVRDDGTGFDVPSVLSSRGRRGLGLIAMQERLNAIGGNLDIQSAVGRGTELVITFPLEK